MGRCLSGFVGFFLVFFWNEAKFDALCGLVEPCAFSGPPEPLPLGASGPPLRGSLLLGCSPLYLQKGVLSSLGLLEEGEHPKPASSSLLGSLRDSCKKVVLSCHLRLFYMSIHELLVLNHI